MLVGSWMCGIEFKHYHETSRTWVSQWGDVPWPNEALGRVVWLSLHEEVLRPVRGFLGHIYDAACFLFVVRRCFVAVICANVYRQLGLSRALPVAQCRELEIRTTRALPMQVSEFYSGRSNTFLVSSSCVVPCGASRQSCNDGQPLGCGSRWFQSFGAEVQAVTKEGFPVDLI